jgi:hypothetical protein
MNEATRCKMRERSPGVQIDTIAIRLRMRGSHEAGDIGIRLCQESYRAVYGCYFLAAIPVMAVSLATFEIAAWLPGILIWWFKPWLDRSALFALARAAFGQPTTWRDLWRENRQVWRSQIIKSLTTRRLSPWRSLSQPVLQLEGQHGAALRRRVKQVRTGKSGAALLMTSVFSSIELVFVTAITSLLFWFAPAGQDVSLFGLFGAGESSVLFEAFVTVAYAVVVLFLEPLYVAAGFGMYLGRRVELEAWDVEQELRRAFA